MRSFSLPYFIFGAFSTKIIYLFFLSFIIFFRNNK